MKNTALQSTLDNVAAQVATVGEWQAELDAARAEVDAAEADRPLTPRDSVNVAQRRVAARERVQVALDALETASAFERAARRAAVAAEADAMDAPIREARKALDTFRTKLTELLKPLQEHTGRTDWGTTAGNGVPSHVPGASHAPTSTLPRDGRCLPSWPAWSAPKPS